jgi:hypothetical protein
VGPTAGQDDWEKFLAPAGISSAGSSSTYPPCYSSCLVFKGSKLSPLTLYRSVTMINLMYQYRVGHRLLPKVSNMTLTGRHRLLPEVSNMTLTGRDGSWQTSF